MTSIELIEEYLKTCWVGLYGEADIDMNGVFTSVFDTREQLAYIVFDHDFEFFDSFKFQCSVHVSMQMQIPFKKKQELFSSRVMSGFLSSHCSSKFYSMFKRAFILLQILSVEHCISLPVTF